MRRVVTRVDLDMVLSWADGTVLDQCLTERLLPLADKHGVGVINAAAVALGLLTARG